MEKDTNYDAMRQMSSEEREAYFLRALQPTEKEWEEAKDIIVFEKDAAKHTATITFNRPEKKNAIPWIGLPRITHLIRETEYDDDVKVLIFQSNGDNFGTGFDAGELGFYIGFGDGTSKEQLKRPSQRRRVWADRDGVFSLRGFEGALLHYSKVSIAAVKGYCYAIHLQLAMACDMTIASEDTLFSHPAWRYLGPIFNYYMLLDSIGRKATMELLFTGGPFTAERAYNLGMVNAVVPKDQVEKEAREWAEAVQSRSLDGIVMGKALMEMVCEARGMSHGTLAAWVGHPWMTNQVYSPNEYNWTKERRDKGFAKSLEEVDARLPERFQLRRKR